jgi:hypothetical protein
MEQKTKKQRTGVLGAPTSTTAVNTTIPPPPPPPKPRDVQKPWVLQFSRRSNVWYYFNLTTGESRYDRPPTV